MDVKIYRGSPAALLPLAMAWQEICNLEDFGFKESYPKFFDSMRELIKDGDKELLVLLEKDVPVGILGLYTYQLPVSEQLICSEHLWFVLPEYRRGSYLLVKTAQIWAKERGCTHYQSSASHLSSDMHDKLCKIYERFGMRPFETIYIKELKDDRVPREDVR